MSATPSVCDYLAVPFLVEAETIETGPGCWTRRVTCPELPGCVVEAPTIEEAMEQVERRRVELLLAALRRGEAPPMPRPPLRDFDCAGLIDRLGLRREAALLLRASP